MKPVLDGVTLEKVIPPLRRVPRTRRVVPGELSRRIAKNGTVTVHSVGFQVTFAHAGQEVIVLVEEAGVTFVDVHGEVLAEHEWPPVGVSYVSKRTGEWVVKKQARVSPMS
jgi:hypothetical protein